MEDIQEQKLSDGLVPKEVDTALLAIARWARFLSIIGFSVGSFVVVAMLVSGKEVFNAVISALPVKVDGLYWILMIGFYIVFFLMAAFLYFLFKAATLLAKGATEKNTLLIADGFLHLKKFFWILAIMVSLGLFSNLFNLFL